MANTMKKIKYEDGSWSGDYEYKGFFVKCDEYTPAGNLGRYKVCGQKVFENGKKSMAFSTLKEARAFIDRQ